MNRKRSKGIGKWTATLFGLAGAATALILDPKSGAKRRRKIRETSSAVVNRPRAQISAMVGAAKTKVPKNASLKSTELESAIMAALFANGVIGVDVRVRSGVVKLRGEVSSLDEIRNCEAIVRAVEGVGEVDNVLRLSA